MHISTVDILEIKIDMANITFAVKYEVMHWPTIGIFTFDLGRSKDQSKSHS